jgi:transposase-like protein
MSDTFSKVEVITGVARRRRFSTEQKLALVAETLTLAASALGNRSKIERVDPAT